MLKTHTGKKSEFIMLYDWFVKKKVRLLKMRQFGDNDIFKKVNVRVYIYIYTH